MQDAPSGSPLALPDGAWSNRTRSTVSAWQFAVASLLMLRGAAGAISPLGLGLLLKLPVPEYLLWIHIPEAITIFVLGIALWRGNQPLIRKSLALVLMISAAIRSALLLGGAPLSEAWWIAIPLALASATVSVGVWRARDWARRGCVVLGLALCARELSSWVYAFGQFVALRAPNLAASAIREGERRTELLLGMITGVLVILIPPVALMAYGVLRSTQKHFADARDEIARARAVPG